ncbi:hypothetical protein [Caldimonas tepidiphila]|uniref:hypothetical protein n=1 Tax=Caldimonas tepidiphila TaxID=2315841 RepID=UPI000E5BFC5D|nr:hypothetical protein [Caldimonas tepidiphila]
MTRCPPAWPALALAAALALPATAQEQVQRSFPQNALRGQIAVVQPPEITLNGQPARLAPGARIRGRDNLLVMSGAIVGQAFPANYTLDTYGLVMDVWLLRPEEAGRPWPRTPQEAAALNFDPVAQTWSKR